MNDIENDILKTLENLMSNFLVKIDRIIFSTSYNITYQDYIFEITLGNVGIVNFRGVQIRIDDQSTISYWRYKVEKYIVDDAARHISNINKSIRKDKIIKLNGND